VAGCSLTAHRLYADARSLEVESRPLSNLQGELTPMLLKPSNKISECLVRVADLRQRASEAKDSASKAHLHDLALQWLAVLDSYKFMEGADRFLKDVRARQSAPEKLAQKENGNWPADKRVEIGPAVNDASLADLLGVLVRAAIEHADGKARAAFYLADPAGASSYVTSSECRRLMPCA